MRNGDRVTIDPLPDDVLTDHVTLAGHVQRPGPYEWRPGMRLTDLIRSVNDLKPDADRRYVLIQRQADRTGPIQVFSADLAAALAAPGGPADPMLQNLDAATVFDIGSGRISVMAPLLRQLRQQAVYGNPAREVEIGGMVHAPGTYPLEEGMRVSDLVRAGGDLNESAYGLSAEITRYEVEGGIATRHRPAGGRPGRRAGRRPDCGPRTRALRPDQHPAGVAVAAQGLGDDRGRGAVPGPLHHRAGREALERAGAGRRA